jgi:alpha-D-xyloside xylohydrolase
MDGSVIFVADNGHRLRVTPYGNFMIRIQRAVKGAEFLPDNHYEMVQKHDWFDTFTLTDNKDGYIELSTSEVTARVKLRSLTVSFSTNNEKVPVLQESQPFAPISTQLQVEFNYDTSEHFTGLGHGYFSRAQSIDLRGRQIKRNYGKEAIEQAPLIVPFYLSSKGYGVFLNSMFPNTFSFGHNKQYKFGIDNHGFNGQLDYFFIGGSKLTNVLDNYTQLTGRPRLPSKAMFGLQLSDKGHDHNALVSSDEDWWKTKIAEHRAAGYALDHVVNDNRWRAAGGKRCESKIAWDPQRYPDPKSYKQWLDDNGLVSTLDFNRCIAQFSEGWQPSFNLPVTDNIHFKDSAPDLTNSDFSKWFWQIFYDKSLNPALQYPGDALWIDEFDEQGAAPLDMRLANGLSSAEMRNYWFFLIAKALVQQGWDKSDINARPFVWVRGMTAGAQRYATLWSGDIYPSNSDMQGQIRGMQLAGLAGFPYWGHDAGGFYDWDKGLGPDEDMYQRWAMAFGSFSPIWKPHGMGQSRWPLDRSDTSKESATKYSQIRYQLMPYIYSAAHKAARTGLPMARAMILEYQDEPLAWQYDLQYMWGENMLIAPNTGSTTEQNIWLPSGTWYDFQHKTLALGGQVITLKNDPQNMPVFVKQGAIIPMRPYAQSTQFIDKSVLNIDVYTGADGQFELIEDDDKTENYRLQAQQQKTNLVYQHDSATLTVHPAIGGYPQAPATRQYTIRFYTTDVIQGVAINGQQSDFTRDKKSVSVSIAASSIKQALNVQLLR